MALIYIVVILVCTTSVIVGAQEPCICRSQADIDAVELRLLNIEIKLLETVQIQQPENSVSTYIRWGKSKCNLNGTRTIYDGYAAGGSWTHSGRSPSMLCLPREPVWAKFDDKLDKHGGRVIGVKYDQVFKERAEAILGKGKSVHGLVAPCAVCESYRSAHIMIPGRKTCYPGWTREYWGYLMSNHYSHASAGDDHCVDSKPDFVDGGKSNKDGYLLHFVEVRCESLSCPPYVMGRELPCVVCTK